MLVFENVPELCDSLILLRALVAVKRKNIKKTNLVLAEKVLDRGMLPLASLPIKRIYGLN